MYGSIVGSIHVYGIFDLQTICFEIHDSSGYSDLIDRPIDLNILIYIHDGSVMGKKKHVA